MSLASLPEDILLEIERYLTLVDESPQHQTLHALTRTCRHVHGMLRRQVLKRYLLRLAENEEIVVFDSSTTKALSVEDILTGVLEPHTANLRITLYTTEADILGMGYVLAYLGTSLRRVILSYNGDGHNTPWMVKLLNACIWIPGLGLDVQLERSFYRSHQRGRFLSPFKFESHEIAPSNSMSSLAVDQKRRWSWWSTNFVWPLSLQQRKSRTLKQASEAPPHIHDTTVYATSANYGPPGCAVALPSFHPQISSFCVRGQTLFTSSLYPWTSHVLNTAPLVSLTLSDISWIGVYEWAEILVRATIPTLRHLTLGRIEVYFRDLLAFLYRHDGLEVLDLSKNMPFTKPGDWDSVLCAQERNVTGHDQTLSDANSTGSGLAFLPHLITLMASSTIILNFLQQPMLKVVSSDPTQRHDCQILCNLHAIHVYQERTIAIRTQFWHIYDALAAGSFGQRTNGLHIVLPSLFTNGLVEWLLKMTPFNAPLQIDSTDADNATPDFTSLDDVSPKGTPQSLACDESMRAQQSNPAAGADPASIRRLPGIHKLSLRATDRTLAAPARALFALRNLLMSNQDLWQVVYSSTKARTLALQHTILAESASLSPNSSSVIPSLEAVEDHVLHGCFILFSLPDLLELEVLDI